jgi:hypothetical protein
MRGALALVLVIACKSGTPDAPALVGTSTPGGDAPAVYAFDSLDARPVSSDAFRGKTTVLSFITTGETKAQAQVVFLVKMAENDGDKVNYAIVALQDPQARELVEEYAKFCHVGFPVAMGDPTKLATDGPLGNVSAIPTTVILDAAGRVVFRSSGVISARELRDHMPR